MTTSLEQIRVTDFRPFEGMDFSVQFSGETVHTIRLKEVLDLPAHSNRERKPFSLCFQTDHKTHYFLQGIYTIDHPLLGPLDIFLVPLGIRDGGMQYEAIFS
jgi:hypothetical protein